MSADNYIGILKCADGYRVAHYQAMENLYYWPTGRIAEYKEINPETGEEQEMEEYEERTEINPQMLKEIFHDSKVYTKDESEIQAKKLLEEIGWVEYGIVDINYQGAFPK